MYMYINKDRERERERKLERNETGERYIIAMVMSSCVSAFTHSWAEASLKLDMSQDVRASILVCVCVLLLLLRQLLN